FLTGGVDPSAINTFITERGFPAGSPVTTSNPLQAWLLAGPVFQLGQQVRLTGSLQGGLFLNNAGSLVIQRQGALVPFYRFESDGSGLRPGWSGQLALAYPLNDNTSLQLGVRLLQTAMPIRLFDPSQGIDLPRSETRSASVLTTGISLVKELGSRVAIKTKGTGADPLRTAPATGGTQPSGSPATEKLLPPANAVAIKTKATGGEPVRTSAPGCGPVTITTTHPDGRVEEQTFACPEDAAAYERSTSTRQTQQSSFGTRVSSTAPPKDSTEGTLILAGQLRFRSGGSGGIVTNQSIRTNGAGGGAASAGYASNGMAPPAGGPTLTLFGREAGTGRASGQRTFQPIYNEQTGNGCTTCPVAVPGNPIHGVTVKGGRNQGGDSIRTSRTTGKKTGGDCQEGNAIAGVSLHLRDGSTGAIIASTETDACGNFFFAGMTTHNWKIEIDGVIQRTKTYVFDVSSNADVGGELVAGMEVIEFVVEKIERSRTSRTGSGSDGGNQAKANINTSRSNTKGSVFNNSDTTGNDGVNQTKANINTSRSNSKGILFTGGDTDGDGQPDRFTATSRLQDGSSQPLAVTVRAAPNGNLEVQADLDPPVSQRSNINTSRSNIKRAVVGPGGQVTILFTDGTSRDVTPLAETSAAAGVWQVELQFDDSDDDGQPDFIWSPGSNLAVTAANPAAKRDELKPRPGPGGGPRISVIPLPMYFATDGGAELEAGNQSGNGPEARPGNPIRGVIVKGGRNPGGDIQTLNRSTNAHGEFLWNNLAPGSYRLQAEYRIQIHHTTNLDAVLNLIR
ncbi:MAG TPA: hypothetical protein PKE63_10060, partial [Lacibacter sp.]|nr:hypothetical protein [Lacibacter sp.]